MSAGLGRTGCVRLLICAFDLFGLMSSYISAPKAVVRMTSIQSSQSFIPFRIICVEVDIVADQEKLLQVFYGPEKASVNGFCV
jgi:hypothetical protein